MGTHLRRAVSVALVAIAGTACAQAAAPVPETEIGRLAASMQPGEVKELATKNCNRDLFKMWYDWEEDDIKKYGSQKMFDIICYNNEMKWDPVTRQVLAFNGGHYASFKFITYSADANEWRLMPVPPWMDPRRPDSSACGKEGKDGNKSWPRSHLYDRLAISPERRLFAVNFNGLYLYDIDKQEWAPRIPTSSGGKDAYQVIEYFPEMKACVYECNWGRDLRLWDMEKKEERRLGSYPFGIHGVMEYNPVHKVMIFGAGDAGGGESKGHPNFYLLNNEGKVTTLKPPPIHINCTPRSKLLCDPASGEYVAQDRGDGRFYAFHPIRDEWKELPALRLPDAESLGVAIDTYGVMMFLSRGQAGFRCHLYRHKPTFGEEAGPRADAALSGFTEVKVFQGCRIPAIVLTQKGTLLALAERRRASADHGPVDLILSRSADLGKTWSKPLMIHGGFNHACGNPCPIVDRITGVVWLLSARGNNAQIMLTHSKDDGATWAEPTALTEQTMKKDDDGHVWQATGPNHGIQLSSGRLLATANAGDYSFCFYSDDHGVTWKQGEKIGVRSSECVAVELMDGSVLLNVRDKRQRKENKNRSYALSRDGGQTWGKSAVHPHLLGPECCNSQIRLTLEWLTNGKDKVVPKAGPAATRQPGEDAAR